jgi:hypothetical protein
MSTSGESVKPSLRQILVDSHVSAVAIAVLLFLSLDSAFWALWLPLSPAANFLFTAMAILDIPYHSRTLTLTDRFSLFIAFSYLFNCFVYLAAARLLSRWVYGMGPLRSLSMYRTRLARRNHV